MITQQTFDDLELIKKVELNPASFALLTHIVEDIAHHIIERERSNIEFLTKVSETLKQGKENDELQDPAA